MHLEYCKEVVTEDEHDFDVGKYQVQPKEIDKLDDQRCDHIGGNVVEGKCSQHC